MREAKNQKASAIARPKTDDCWTLDSTIRKVLPTEFRFWITIARDAERITASSA